MPPKTHNLISLLGKTNLELSEEDTDFLQTMNVFQIEGRYPDHLTQLNKTISRERTEGIIAQVKQLFVCLQEQFKPSPKSHARKWANVLAAEIGLQVFVVRGHGNHSGVIGAVFKFRDIHVPIIFYSQLYQCRPQT